MQDEKYLRVHLKLRNNPKSFRNSTERGTRIFWQVAGPSPLVSLGYMTSIEGMDSFIPLSWTFHVPYPNPRTPVLSDVL